MNVPIKIAICCVTYNGSTRIVDCLNHISALIIPNDVSLSLVVVDNASTDDTFLKIQTYWNQQNLNIDFVLKRMDFNDLALARLLAYENLECDYVITCDDDNLLPPNYLEIGLSYFNAYPKIGVLGAQGLLTTSQSIPKWFDDYAYVFACGQQAKFTGNVYPERNVVYGAGMWHKHTLYLKAQSLGFTSFVKSRRGKKLGGGEDSELCWAIKFLGYEIWYADNLSFKHKISDDKLTENYKNKLVKSLLVQKNIYSNLHFRIFNNKISALYE